jgi:hypothetical protein
MTVNKTGPKGARRLSSSATGRSMLEQRRALAVLDTVLAWQRHSAR